MNQKTNIRKGITQAEIKELRELIEYSEDSNCVKLFNKFHNVFNKLAVFYKEKKNDESKTLFYWNEYDKISKEKRRVEEELKKQKLKTESIKKQLDKEIQNSVELYQKYREIQIENEKLKK